MSLHAPFFSIIELASSIKSNACSLGATITPRIILFHIIIYLMGFNYELYTKPSDHLLPNKDVILDPLNLNHGTV